MMTTMGLGYALRDAAMLTTDLDEAQRLAAEADQLLRATGSPIGIAHTVGGSRDHRVQRDELADAAGFVAEAVEIFSSCGNLGCCAAHVGGGGDDRRSGAASPRRQPNCWAPPRSCGSGAAEAASQVRAGRAAATSRIPSRHSLPPCSEAALAAGRQHTLESAARAALAALSTVARE